MAYDEGVIGAQRCDQRQGVLREQRRFVALVGRPAGGSVAAHERRDAAKPRVGQRRQQVTVGVGVVRKAMQTQHQRAAARFEIMEIDAVRVDIAAAKLSHWRASGEIFDQATMPRREGKSQGTREAPGLRSEQPRSARDLDHLDPADQRQP